MKNQEKIFVIGHKNPDTDLSAQQSLTAISKTEPHRTANILRSVRDRSMKKQNTY